MFSAKLARPLATTLARRELHASSTCRARRSRGGTPRTSYAGDVGRPRQPTPFDWLLSSEANLGLEGPGDAGRKETSPAAPTEPPETLFDLNDLPDHEGDDMSTAGHRLITQDRQVLTYLRLIDGDMQKLKGKFASPMQRWTHGDSSVESAL
jgi:hypothetical protein